MTKPTRTKPVQTESNQINQSQTDTDSHLTHKVDTSSNEAVEELISRSQRKREAEEITQLGRLISELPASDLAKIPLEERVATAVDELRNIRSFGARKRQLHYLGKVLRKTELEPIRAALKALQLSATSETRLLHNAEQWREKLLTAGDSALTDFLQLYPQADRQRLRQLTRQHNKENQATLPATTKSARELFKIIRKILVEAADD